MNLRNSKLLLIFLIFILHNNIISQKDSSTINPNKLILLPSFHGLQFDAISILVSSELGLSVDYDIYSSTNKKQNFGFRIGTEYYDFISLDVGGKTVPGPFWDFNIYGRYSLRAKYLWFSPIVGLSFHNSLDKNYTTETLLLKWGFELKYNVFKENLGLIIKFANSTTDYSGYFGIGVAICI